MLGFLRPLSKNTLRVGILLMAGVLVSFGDARIRSPYDNLSLDQMLGQMLMVGFRGDHAEQGSKIATDIQKHHLGGVVLYTNDLAKDKSIRNVRTPEQLKKLVQGLHRASQGSPLLVAVDQEGGQVRRLKKKFGFDGSQSAARLGKEDVEINTRNQSRRTADILSRYGINLNLAPVVDLNLNPNNPVIAKHDRSYGVHPSHVARHARAFVQGHRTHNVLTSLKHFPGHGSSHHDSHRGIVDVTDTWKSSELAPFKNLIASQHADTVMVAHLYQRKLDAHLPATLSRSIVHDKLRTEMGYDGVVITDDLQMEAITQSFGETEAAILAVQAGVDILLYANNTTYDDTVLPRIIGSLKSAVLDGRIERSRIEESYGRIMALKSRLRPTFEP